MLVFLERARRVACKAHRLSIRVGTVRPWLARTLQPTGDERAAVSVCCSHARKLGRPASFGVKIYRGRSCLVRSLGSAATGRPVQPDTPWGTAAAPPCPI